LTWEQIEWRCELQQVAFHQATSRPFTFTEKCSHFYGFVRGLAPVALCGPNPAANLQSQRKDFDPRVCKQQCPKQNSVMPDQDKDTSKDEENVTSEMNVTLPTQVPGGERTEGVKKQIRQVAEELVGQNVSPEELQDLIGSEKNNPPAPQVQQPAGQAGSSKPEFDLRKEKSDPLIGQIIDKKYEILEVLGEGGMGRVYKVKHVLTGKIQALKILRSHLASKATSVRRFQREAKAASRIDHPNCVTVTDFGDWEDMFYMVMEYVSGPSLSRIIRENGRRNSLPLKRALPIFIQICAGLEAAHKHGITHRDVKSSNVVLISKDGTDDFVKVLDFGIAKFGPAEGEATLTESGEVFGSPFYMSPEQCLGKDMDARSDIYSLGCLMYETLSGRVPLEGENVIATITKQTSEAPEKIIFDADVDRTIGDRLNDLIVLRALAKDPKDRPQTMAELQKHLLAIQAALDDPSLAKKLLKSIRSTQEFRAKGWKQLIYSSIAVLFCLTMGLGYLVQMRDVWRQDAELKTFADKTAHIERTIQWVEPPASTYAMNRDQYLSKEHKLLEEQSALGLIGAMGTKLEVRSRLNLGSLYLDAGSYDEAKKQLQNAFALATDLKMDKNADTASDVEKIAYGLAQCYFHDELYKQSIAYGLKYSEIELKFPDKEMSTFASRAIVMWGIIGRSYELLKMPTQARNPYSFLYTYVLSSHYSQTASDRTILAAARASDFFLRACEYQKASDLLEWAIAAWRRNGGNVNECVALNNYGFARMKQHDWTNALQAFRNAHAYATKVHAISKEDMFKILLNEADCYRELNDAKKSDECLREAQKFYSI
jgi:serine/threonine protein kinase